MARKKTAAPKHVEPEDESQEVEEQEEPETEEQDDEPENGGKAISKAAAVRDALEQGEESPDDGVAYIKRIHGIEISKQMFSSYKTKEKSRLSENQQSAAPKGKPGRKPREVAEPGQVTPAPKSAPATGDMIDDLVAVKQLVQKLGADQVRKIVGLFE